ncbi:hypothetical protein Dsin_027035 [Dipteronia sinensis]|uniref:RNase H type-1 domain-containing protein n=1 Tax=Dipteronia sinensis TaxID=43782 RepID=A0AAD9ZYR5_9ROSI|nr:hypothetical protein Dsin_027035 [Dipteronia sinensis]
MQQWKCFLLSLESIKGIFPLKVEVFVWQLYKVEKWTPPLDKDLMFNVDRSAKGNPGSTGMGGVLRDSNIRVLCLFSSFLGTHDSNAAEIYAIHKACSNGEIFKLGVWSLFSFWSVFSGHGSSAELFCTELVLSFMTSGDP